ncbi:uncharacterized protein N0V89_006423 [Didymosphaeria variabile]|uniref:Uncharacterized protein n=1 Tax=Didymosphaeria variabile TaxID=1932322 RepID=A0A9W8XN79_9PLEO|nr:uncharacterized protein N0V89_006423 [Didymosphaeria variabile]KAJ4354686.1 hypothetical protein N0V89_006423 [Didymosphaeria variabile]
MVLFPDKEPYLATRMRAQDLANELGHLTDDMFRTWDKDPNNNLAEIYYFSSSEWVASNRINPETNRSFADWAEFFGPVQAAGDNYTRIVS